MVVDKYGVIFILFDGEKIQLEKRLTSKGGLRGFTIVPGGGIENRESEEVALRREVREEYGVEITFFKKLGVVLDPSDPPVIHHGNVYLITNWVGKIQDPEISRGKSVHVEASIPEARKICEHPITQDILNLLEEELSR